MAGTTCGCAPCSYASLSPSLSLSLFLCRLDVRRDIRALCVSLPGNQADAAAQLQAARDALAAQASELDVARAAALRMSAISTTLPFAALCAALEVHSQRAMAKAAAAGSASLRKEVQALRDAMTAARQGAADSERHHKAGMDALRDQCPCRPRYTHVAVVGGHLLTLCACLCWCCCCCCCCSADERQLDDLRRSAAAAAQSMERQLRESQRRADTATAKADAQDRTISALTSAVEALREANSHSMSQGGQAQSTIAELTVELQRYMAAQAQLDRTAAELDARTTDLEAEQARRRELEAAVERLQRGVSSIVCHTWGCCTRAQVCVRVPCMFIYAFHRQRTTIADAVDVLENRPHRRQARQDNVIGVFIAHYQAERLRNTG